LTDLCILALNIPADFEAHTRAVLRHLIKLEISSLWTKSEGFSP
jgi:hypothetical protein